LAVASTLLNIWLLVVNWGTERPGEPEIPIGELLSAVAYVAVATIGLVVVRRGDGLVGWLFMIAGVSLAVGAFASEYATYGILTDAGSLPAPEFVAWLGACLWWAGAGLGLTFGVLLYPDGTVPSATWRPVAWCLGANLVVLILLHALTPGPLEGEFQFVVNPFGLDRLGPALVPLRDMTWALLALNAAVSAGSAVARLRGDPGPNRTHIAWLGAAAGVAVVAAPVWGITTDEAGRPPLATAVIVVAVFAVPLAVSAALARSAVLNRSVERLIMVREDERRRIRRDLHDGLGPTLAGVALQVDLARSLLEQDPDGAATTLERVASRVQEAIGDVRRIVDELRPPVLDQLGLVAAIREGAGFLTGRVGGDCSLTVEVNGHLGLLPPVVEEAAFRIVMEAATNACRHGRAHSLRVELTRDAGLHIEVEDDGRGLPAAFAPGVGLQSMRDRAAELGGWCVVEPRSPGGTVVRAFLPLQGP
jgi:signal transduction histidine kinase